MPAALALNGALAGFGTVIAEQVSGMRLRFRPSEKATEDTKVDI